MGRHVLVARMDSAGDVLLSGPAVRAVAATADRVTYLCGPRGRAAAELLPGVDDVLCHHCPWIDADPRPVTAEAMTVLAADVAACDVDEAFVLTSFHQSPLPLALVLRLADVEWIAATSVDYPGALLDVRHRIGDGVHEVVRALSLVATGGYLPRPGDDGALGVRLPATPPPLPGPYVVVHPGAAVRARAWPRERHAALVAALAAGGRTVAVTGSPAEAQLTGRVAGAANGAVHDLGGRTSLAELAELLARADVLVTGNTGPAHLAAAVGTPVVSLYAPTVPAARWRPWRVAHELLCVDVPCAGCRARVCPVAGHPCMTQIAVEDVLAAIERLAPAPRAKAVIAA